MATKVLDQERVAELVRAYRPDMQVTKAGGGTLTFNFLCPFHTDTRPSFIYAPAVDRGHCFACKAKATMVDLVSKWENTPVAVVRTRLTKEGYYTNIKREDAPRKTSPVSTSMAQIQAWHELLATNVALRTKLISWGWTDAVIKKHMLGSSDGRLVIPMFEHDTIVNVKFYSPGATNMKYQNMAGAYQACWPLDNLNHSKIYLVEGEKDCLTMISQGFNAVTFTSGANSIPKAYLKYFSGKDVVIIYDIDEAGHKGSVAVANALTRIANTIKIVDLPPGELDAKGDITDYYVKLKDQFKHRIESLEANSDEYQSPDAMSRVPVPETVIRTYLEDLVREKMFFKRVNVKVRVINNSNNETCIIPREVTLQCNRDYKEVVCSTCPLYYEKEGIPLFIKPEYPEIMSIVGNNMKKQREALRSMCDINETCPRFKVEYKSFQALYPIVLIPAIEADKKKHSYSLVNAWAMDVPAEENEDYDVDGVVLANPETQKMELVCYRMERDAASIDSFELTDEMKQQLEVFKCKNPPSEPSQKN